MNVLVLMGSPRKEGNTAALLRTFCEEMERLGAAVETEWLYGYDIRPCVACRTCQDVHDGFGCPQRDDVQTLFEKVLACDLLVFATPIYAWYCTPPMKALLDRLIYGMNKFYGAEKGLSLWEGKAVAVLTTCGYRPEKGSDLFLEGIRRCCRHSGLRFLGSRTERHLGYDTEFMDADKEKRLRTFAAEIQEKLSEERC